MKHNSQNQLILILLNNVVLWRLSTQQEEGNQVLPAFT
jgi:hypothetical protein